MAAHASGLGGVKPQRSWFSRLWPAAVYQFCFIGGVAMLKPGANALVLSRFHSSALPWLYMAAAIITGGLAILGAGTSRRASPFLLALVGGVTSLLCALGMWVQLPFVSLIAYLFSESYATQVSLAFWGAVSESFDARESRRAFTWINGVGMSGAIFGGLLAQRLATSAGAIALLIVGGALLFAGASAWHFHTADAESASSAPKQRAPWNEVLAVPYTQLLAVMVLGFALLQILVDYVFRERAVEQLVEADMASLFASHQLWTGVFCVLFQFVLAEVLLRRLGILRYIGLVPVGLGLLTLGTWAVRSVWSAWALKVFEGAASWSLMPVAMQLLYAPLADELRDGVRRTVDGFLRKVGMGLAGLVLLGLAQFLGPDGVLAVVALLCLLEGWVLVRIRPRYVEAVHARVSGFEPESVFDTEERLLLEALKSPDPDRVLRAIDLLSHAQVVSEVHVMSLLSHAHERVQERGVLLAQSLHVTSAGKQLEALIGGTARRPRDNAVWALARLNPDRAALVLPLLLDTKDIGLLTATVGGLLLMNHTHPTARAMLDRLLARGPTSPPALRREVARLLGRLGRDSTVPAGQGDPRAKALQSLLDDADPSVRRIAIRSAGEGQYTELAPKLLRFLSWRDDRRAARESLALLGDEVVTLLAATLDDRSRALNLRLQLPRVLRHIATQSALDALLFSNANDEPSLHFRVGMALVQLHEEHPSLRVDRERVLEALERRRQMWLRLLQPWLDLRAGLGDASLLTRVLGDRLDQSVELSFALLGLLHDARVLRRAQAHLMGADKKRRAWALELVDNVLSPEERALVAEQVDFPHPSRPVGDAEQVNRHADLLAFADDFVLRACARKVARWLGRWNEPNREDDMNDQILRKLFALESVEIFAQSDVDDLAAVAAVAKERVFHPSEKIYLEGDPGDALYVIVEGAAEARRDGEVVMTMHARESFGETSLFDGAPRINEVVAIAETRALVIDRRDFLDLLAERPELLSGMFRVMSRQLKSMVVEVAARRATTGEMPIVTAGAASPSKSP